MKKADQAAFILNKLTNNKMLIGICLYLADRKSLIQTGLTITERPFINMENGPGLDVGPLKFDSDDSELSDYDIETLKEIFEQNKSLTNDELVCMMKSLPEWQPNNIGCIIEYKTVMMAAGLSQKMIHEFIGFHNEIKYVLSLKKNEEARYQKNKNGCDAT